MGTSYPNHDLISPSRLGSKHVPTLALNPNGTTSRGSRVPRAEATISALKSILSGGNESHEKDGLGCSCTGLIQWCGLRPRLTVIVNDG